MDRLDEQFMICIQWDNLTRDLHLRSLDERRSHEAFIICYEYVYVSGFFKDIYKSSLRILELIKINITKTGKN